jgi:hypothetical protein
VLSFHQPDRPAALVPQRNEPSRNLQWTSRFLSLNEEKGIVSDIERLLSVIEELETVVEANLTRADRLRQSILSQAFSGRLVLKRRFRESRCTNERANVAL